MPSDGHGQWFDTSRTCQCLELPPVAATGNGSDRIIASPCQRMRLDFSISLSDAIDGIARFSARSVAATSPSLALSRSIQTSLTYPAVGMPDWCVPSEK